MGLKAVYPEEQGQVVFESFLEGEEFSLMTFVNGIMQCHLIVLHKTTSVRMTMTKV